MNIKQEEEEEDDEKQQSFYAVLNPNDQRYVSELPADGQQLVSIKKESPGEWRPGVDQQDPEALNIKKEEEELWTSLDEEQLNVKEQTDDTRFPLAVPLKSEDDEEKPLLSQLPQQQVEGNVHNPDFQLSDTGSKTEDINNKRKEIRSPESGAGTVKASKKVQTKQKRYGCDLCDHRFNRKKDIEAHTSIHTGLKPFCCEVCGQRLSQKSTLNNHMRIHTGQKPFCCEVCGRSFSHKSSVNRHMRLYTGQKPFCCDCCDQRFHQKADLGSHMTIHTDQKPFCCDGCGKRFRDKSHLNRHRNPHRSEAILLL